MKYSVESKKAIHLKSYEIHFNQTFRCMEFCIFDNEGMYPLLINDASAEKVYYIERTKRGGLKMSAI